MKANHAQINRYLKTAKGQIEGIINMVELDRYCVDVSNQLLATIALLQKCNREILKSHIECCVKESLNSDDEQSKLAEVMMLIDKMTK